jgi:hypothetical protein
MDNLRLPDVLTASDFELTLTPTSRPERQVAA